MDDFLNEGEKNMLLQDFINNNRVSYYDLTNNKELLYSNPKKFIRDVLIRGDKVLENMNPSEYRYFHSASIYIMGMVLYKNIPRLKSKINEFIESDDYNEFLYSWFMSTFIHDLGYGVVTSEKPRMWGWTDLYRIKQITYDIIDTRIAHNINVVPQEIANNISKYKVYREWKNERNTLVSRNIEHIDHGHFSSAVFLKDREKKFRDKLGDGKFIKLGNGRFKDSETNLIWSENILNDKQLKVCQVIAGHNVFFQKPYGNDARVYKRLGLEELLIYSPVYNFHEYPFYFLMQLVDTIDLFKSYSRYCNAEDRRSYSVVYLKILSDVKFDFFDSGFIMTFNNFHMDYVKNYWLKIRKECYWLPISIKKQFNKLVIEFQ